MSRVPCRDAKERHKMTSVLSSSQLTQLDTPMPPKRKRAEAEAGIATRSTRKSTRTDKHQDDGSTNASSSSAEMESLAPSKKARTAIVKATSVRSRSSRAMQVNDDRLVSPSTNPDKNE